MRLRRTCWLIYLASGFLADLLNAPIASARPPWRAHHCGDHSGAQKRPEAHRRAQKRPEAHRRAQKLPWHSGCNLGATLLEAPRMQNCRSGGSSQAEPRPGRQNRTHLGLTSDSPATHLNSPGEDSPRTHLGLTYDSPELTMGGRLPQPCLHCRASFLSRPL